MDRRVTVIDAGVVVDAILQRVDGERAFGGELVAPHLLDSEVTHALRRHVARGVLTEQQGLDAIRYLGQLDIDRRPVTGLLARIWELRHTLTAYDATYVALAEALNADALLTTDARLARAPGIRCAVHLV